MYGIARIFAAAPPDSHNPGKWTTAFWKNSKIIGLCGRPGREMEAYRRYPPAA
jgi:hypothetical protein